MNKTLESPDELREEVERLNGELRKLRRSLQLTERVAKRSESMAMQSKRAMLRTNKELEQRVAELRAAKVAAEESAATKARFLATMSHELRTPLNGMVGSSELLLSTSLGEEQRDLVALLQRSGNALLEIVNDVLDYSRLEADGMPIERAAFRIEQCVADVVELQRQVALGKRIELRMTFHAGVPTVVVGDPGRLRQVLMNLLTNALKFTTQGLIEVSVRPGEAKGEVVFAVSDTGMGIPDEVQPHLFEAFTQAEASTARRFGGTGLGLAVCKRLVGLMGGEIRVESQYGEGATFTFSVDLPAGEESELADEAPAEVRSEAELAGRGRALVVDDSQSNRFIATRMLARLGFECDEAVDGVDAAARAAGQDYRIVFMDCSMPVMDGFDATSVIRSMPGSRGAVPIVALTAYSMPEDKARCKEVGMSGYLTKPLRLADLSAAVDRILQEADGQERAEP